MNRSLVALRGEWGKEAKEEFAELHETPSEYTQLTDWTFGELPELMEVPVGKQTVIGYPALVDDGETVSLKVFDSAEEATETHRKGLARLFMLQFKEQVKYFDKNVPGMSQMGMQFMTLGSLDDLRNEPLIDEQDQSVFIACRTLFKHHSFEPIVAQKAADLIAAAIMVSGGFGTALVPESILNLQLPNVVFRPLVTEVECMIDLNCAYRKDEEPPLLNDLLACVHAYQHTQRQPSDID